MSARDSLTPEQRAALAEQLGDAKPARSSLLVSFGQTVQDRREHDHSTQREDWFCLNLSAYMGERMAPVLRRLLDAEAELERVKGDRAEAGKVTPTGDEITQPAELTIYRASHESIVMGLYTTREAAQAHCEAKAQQEEPAGSIRRLSWSADDIGDQAEYELHITPAETGGLIRGTGYVVTPLTVASAYDEEADE